MMIYGKSSQDGTPSPENPVEIKSVVNPTVKVSNEDGTKSQTVTLLYTLNAIPVSSDGNVTIDGQQYVADYVDVERGKLVRMCKEKVFDGTEKWRSELSYMVADIPNFSYVDNNNHEHMTYLLCNKYKVSKTIGDNDNLIFIRINGDGVVIKDTLHQSTVDDWKNTLMIIHALCIVFRQFPKKLASPQKKSLHLKHLQHIIRLQTSASIQNSWTDIQYLTIRLAWLMVGTM